MKKLFSVLLAMAGCLALHAEIVLISPIKETKITTMPPQVNAYLQLPDTVRRDFFAEKTKRTMLFDAREPIPYEFKWRCTRGESGPFRILISMNEDFSTKAGVFVIDNLATAPYVYSVKGDATAREQAAKIVNFEIGRKYYWKVGGIDGKGEETWSKPEMFVTEDLPPRMILIPKVVNTRDLGGWVGLNGKKVKQGMIFRSAGLNENSPDFHWDKKKWRVPDPKEFTPGENRLTPEAKAFITSVLKWKTEIDLRRPSEVGSMTVSMAGRSVKFVHIPSDCYDGLFTRSTEVIEDGKGPERLAQAFKLFCDKRNYPIDFHCIAGTDRTGTLAYMLLAVLGVSEEDILKDWELSGYSYLNYDMMDGIRKHLDKCGTDKDSLQVKAENYLKTLGLTDKDFATFRDIMLEK